MSKAENFTVRMDADLKQRMKAHPEINWSHVIREHVRSMLDDVERMDQLASESDLTKADVEELAAMIDAAAAERARDDRETADSDTRTRRGDEEQRRDRTDVDAS